MYQRIPIFDGVTWHVWIYLPTWRIESRLRVVTLKYENIVYLFYFWVCNNKRSNSEFVFFKHDRLSRLLVSKKVCKIDFCLG